MRTLKKTVALVAIAVTTVGGYLGNKVYNKPVESTLLMQNVEALSQTEWTEPMWTIHPYDCTIKGACTIRLGNGSIIKIKADGEFTISGARDCAGGGNYACEPITCEKLYSVIL